MILLLDTSTQDCRIYCYDNKRFFENIRDADRRLAQELFANVKSALNLYHYSLADVSSIGVFLGPGSFTGLRIGITFANTFAHINKIPIVGAVGKNWKQLAVKRLLEGHDDQLVVPNYGSSAKISHPKK